VDKLAIEGQQTTIGSHPLRRTPAEQYPLSSSPMPGRRGEQLPRAPRDVTWPTFPPRNCQADHRTANDHHPQPHLRETRPGIVPKKRTSRE
jgi:hypothetical protein